MFTCQQNINGNELLAAYFYLILSSGNLSSKMPSLERVLCIMVYVVDLKPIFLNHDLGSKVLKGNRKAFHVQKSLGNAELKYIKRDFCFGIEQLLLLFLYYWRLWSQRMVACSTSCSMGYIPWYINIYSTAYSPWNKHFPKA